MPAGFLLHHDYLTEMLDSLRCANESRIPHIPVTARFHVVFTLLY